MGYGTSESVSYEVQPTNTQEHAKNLLGKHEAQKSQSACLSGSCETSQAIRLDPTLS
jgi:hypothetical protein